MKRRAQRALVIALALTGVLPSAASAQIEIADGLVTEIERRVYRVNP